MEKKSYKSSFLKQEQGRKKTKINPKYACMYFFPLTVFLNKLHNTFATQYSVMCLRYGNELISSRIIYCHLIKSYILICTVAIAVRNINNFLPDCVLNLYRLG